MKIQRVLFNCPECPTWNEYEKKDRFKRVDNAIDQLRKEFDEVVDESNEAGGRAREDVRETIDDVEARIAKLRKRTDE